MVKDHLGITFRVRVSGWMVGWMDGWMDGSIDQSPSIHLHQYIDLFYICRITPTCRISRFGFITPAGYFGLPEKDLQQRLLQE